MTEAATVTDLSIERLLHLDQRIDANESDALRARWEFGHQMLAARDGAGRLPNGYLADLVERTGKSRRELGYRVQFASVIDSEEELCNALHSFTSWRDLVRDLKRTQADLADLYPEPARILLCTNGTVERDGTRRHFGLPVPATHSDPVAAAADLYGWPVQAYRSLEVRT